MVIAPRGRAALPQRPACYARVSLDRDGYSVGVSDQVREAKHRAERLGWPEPALYSDNDISAADRRKRRPGFERLLQDIQSGVIDALVVRHLDRLLRQVADLERVLDAIDAANHPVQVVLLEGGQIDLTSASGRLLARILTSVAANESEIKSERLVQARHRDAQAGRAHQALGYGYNADRTINKEQARIVREVARRLLDDGETWGSIVADLNRRMVPLPWAGKWTGKGVDSLDTEWGRINHPTLHAVIRLVRSPGTVDLRTLTTALRAAGSSFSRAELAKRPEVATLADEHVGLTHSQTCQLLSAAGLNPPARGWNGANLRTMMARGALCGWRDHAPEAKSGGTSLRGRRIGRMVARGDWEPLLSKDQVEAIRATIETGGRQTVPRHLLSGVLVCGRCGKRMVGAFSSDERVTGKRGGTTWRYLCPKRKSENTSGCGLSIAGEVLDEVVTGWVLGALVAEDFRSRAQTRPADPRVKEAEDRLATYGAERATIRRMWSSGALSVAEYEDDLMAILEREKSDRAVVDSAWPQEAVGVVSDAPRDPVALSSWWDSKDLGAKRTILRSLIASIPVLPSPTGRGRGTPPAQRLGDPEWRI